MDVAYRYFATPRRKVHHRRHPGPRAVHRNMVTGASTADVAVPSSSTPARASSSSPGATPSSPPCCAFPTSSWP
ncbi:MAG: hypothetical protein ACRD07_08840 [Acidimicrobiales bacterium]